MLVGKLALLLRKVSSSAFIAGRLTEISSKLERRAARAATPNARLLVDFVPEHMLTDYFNVCEML
ncbi:hypothetical protein NECAME_18214 [Necator americanus]|uniref:Uncharacterized protein n=1 Tax=Necator americanus TaxID=51031 RepID=W2T8T3_NECAM|nr:hypothetical protein NECAME_18214 [Necator americanus]ETN78415.1 hypothetical protein NECAME_18214 [Necator americanus]